MRAPNVSAAAIALLAIVCVASVLLIACGSGDGDPAPSPLPINPIAMAAGDFESKLLADGELTFEEYERGFLAFGECAKTHGWEFPEPPRLTSRQNYEFRLYRPNSEGVAPETIQASQQAVEDCRMEYFDEIQRIWSLKTALSGVERQAARDDLGRCLEAAGYDLPEHPSSDDWTPFIVVSSGLDLAARRTFGGTARS